MSWIVPPLTHSNTPPPNEVEQMTAIARKYDVAGDTTSLTTSATAVDALAWHADPLRPLPKGDQRVPRKRGPRRSTSEPSFLSDQQRDLIGSAGEYAAHVHLKRTVRNFSDEHWVSFLG